MTYIKKLVMQGFKSFAKKTEIEFTKNINVIVGLNGSGKSNISDALCFVLGRLSAKSMRASKAKNLLFMGSEGIKPAKEAYVEVVFDNEGRVFAIDRDEITLKRIIKRNGQSTYKINNETKTRQEVLMLLAQAGIDPNGFNIILQGEIQRFTKMKGEERRKIIEEISGISVYEVRKEKALRELEKTEEKLKEISAILRERTSYLNNLEKERQQALRFKKLESDVKRLKASILFHDLNNRKKESKKITSEIDLHNNKINKLKEKIISYEKEINSLKEKINELNSKIQSSTGLEQEQLNREIANIRAEIAGLNVRIENLESKLIETQNKKQDIENKSIELENEIRELEVNTPTVSMKQKEFEKKKKQLEELEIRRKKYYITKTELKTVKERIEEKEFLLKQQNKEADFLVEQIETLTKELFDINSSEEKIKELKIKEEKLNQEIKNLEELEEKIKREINFSESEIERLKKLIEKIASLDVCPLCKNKITEEHIASIKRETEPQILEQENKKERNLKELKEIKNKIETLIEKEKEVVEEIRKRESDIIKLKIINEKTEQIKKIKEKIKQDFKEIGELRQKQTFLQESLSKNKDVEEKYEQLKIEIDEIALISEQNLDSEIAFKRREKNRIEASLKQLKREEQEAEEELELMKKDLEKKEKLLEKMLKEEEELSKKFKKLIEKRDALHEEIRKHERQIMKIQTEIRSNEEKRNMLKIEEARINAEIENLEKELLEFQGIEFIRDKKDSLIKRLQKTKEALEKIGSVNLRALEVYEEIKKEYEAVKQRVETIEKEKEKILKVIHEIDVKKKKTFLNTFNSINEHFSKNFSKLSSKGEVYLELENSKNPFEGGVDIVVKMGQGKYFDVTSLSGGEQTLVSLSLIFAIQELKPYYFYILDEIDAALDKRNSSRLAEWLKKYIQKGQYIIISHNDEIIRNATALYGVSINKGISKIVSLKV